MSRVTVVYIVCPGHSGSTLLDLLLAANSDMVTVGEAKVLSSARPRPAGVCHCSCGASDLRACRFWARVDGRMREVFGIGIDDLELDSPDAHRFARHNLALFESVSAIAGRPMVIDSSKSLDRLERLLALKTIDVRPIQLRRRAPGVVYSNVKKGRFWARYALSYARHYTRSEDILANVPAYRLRYESLASEPRETLIALMRWLGPPFEESQLDWRGQPHHSVAGNRMRFGTDSVIRVDDAWKTGLSAFEKAGTALLTSPAALRTVALVAHVARRVRHIRPARARRATT